LRGDSEISCVIYVQKHSRTDFYLLGANLKHLGAFLEQFRAAPTYFPVGQKYFRAARKYFRVGKNCLRARCLRNTRPASVGR
jgi:hypothetical protein